MWLGANTTEERECEGGASRRQGSSVSAVVLASRPLLYIRKSAISAGSIMFFALFDNGDENNPPVVQLHRKNIQQGRREDRYTDRRTGGGEIETMQKFPERARIEVSKSAAWGYCTVR